MTYPHCDSNIVHFPGECDYCDMYPQLQAKRLMDRINFTGHNDPSLSPCPADKTRGHETYNKWPGNRPQKGHSKDLT